MGTRRRVSVAEATFDAWVAQEEGRTKSGAKILYDARVAPPDTDLADEESLAPGHRARLRRLRTGWTRRSSGTGSCRCGPAPDEARRFYLNQPVASQDAWATQQEWAAIADPAQVMADVSDGDEIVAFFDG